MNAHREIKTLPGGSTVGIFGGGQLGKMLVTYGTAKLGFKSLIYTDVPGCACDVSPHIIAPYDDRDKLREFFSQVSVVVLEFENIPSMVYEVWESMPEETRPAFYPGRKALEISQSRVEEKRMAQKLGIKTPKFWIIDSSESATQIADAEYPVILKTASGGYDGKGQRKVHSMSELLAAYDAFGSVLCIAEEVIDFDMEFSVILARDQHGQTVAYVPFRNTHCEGILDETEWPYGGTLFQGSTRNAMIRHVWGMAALIAKELDLVGLLAVEMFADRNSKIYFNEIAPRPHNSGHITIECAATSQFEQLIRAACGLPLGCTDAIASGTMVNLIGRVEGMFEGNHLQRCTSIHLYGKKPHPRRKLGHVVHLVALDEKKTS